MVPATSAIEPVVRTARAAVLSLLTFGGAVLDSAIAAGSDATPTYRVAAAANVALEITKSRQFALPLCPTRNIAYTVTLKNTSIEPFPVLASIIDTIPAGTTYVPGSVVGGGHNAALARIEWFGFLAQGQSRSVGFSVTVNPGTPDGTRIMNTATGTIGELGAPISTDDSLACASATATATLRPSPTRTPTPTGRPTRTATRTPTRTASATGTAIHTAPPTGTPVPSCSEWIVILGSSGATTSPDSTVVTDIQITFVQPSDAAWTFTSLGAPPGVSVQFVPPAFAGIGSTGVRIGVGTGVTPGTHQFRLVPTCLGLPLPFVYTLTVVGPTHTPTPTATGSTTPTPSPTPTASPSRTPSVTATRTWTPTLSPTPTATATPTPIPPAVLLIHGWGGSCASFATLEPFIEQALVASGYFSDVATARRRVECFDVLGGGQGFTWQDGGISGGITLRDYVERPGGFADRMAPIRNNQIDIVAHSFGGLVSRYYIERLGGAPKVRTLTMLGTPNAGVWLGYLTPLCKLAPLSGPLALVCAALETQAVHDMAPDSFFLGLLNAGLVTPPTDYFVIAGTGDGSVVYWDEAFPNDCVVSLASAGGPFPQQTGSRRVIHTDLPGPPVCAAVTTLTNDAPAGPCASDTQHVLCDVVRRLERPVTGGGASFPPRPYAAAAPLPPAGVAPQTGVAFSPLRPGEVQNWPVMIDASVAEARFVLFWVSDGGWPLLRLKLRKPDGTPIVESGPQVAYAAARPLISGLTVDVYEVTAPDVGQWTMTVEGISVPSAGVSYAVMAFLDSPVSVQAALHPPAGTRGEPITLEARPIGSGMPIADATVVATVESPFGTVRQLVLRDDGTAGDEMGGDGRYGAVFHETRTCGTYTFRFEAAGAGAGGPFNRQTLALANVRATGDAVGNACNSDDDGDGLTDEAEVVALQTDPLRADTDGDGVGDGCETASGSNPTDAGQVPGVPCPPPTPVPDAGDANCDGALLADDLSAVAMAIFNPVAANLCPHADANGDGRVSAADVLSVATRLRSVPP